METKALSIADVCILATKPKNLTRAVASILVLTGALMLGASPASAQNYSFRTVDDGNAQPSGGNPPYTIAYSVNQAGKVVGVFSAPGSTYYGFAGYAGANLTTINWLGACSFDCGTAAYGINDVGEVVGEWDDSQGNAHGFYSIPPYGPSSTYVLPAYPGSYLTVANGVSKSGLIAGIYGDNTGTHGFKYTGGQSGQFSPINFSVCSDTWINAIDDRGDVVGYCDTGNPQSDTVAYELTAAGQLIEISVTGANETRANGIDNAGQIVGYYAGSDFVSHCFVYANGNYSPIPDPPLSAGGAQCYGISNGGQIAGTYTDAQGVTHGFVASGAELLDPVPSMSDLGLMNGPAVADDTILQAVGMHGRPVDGVAADGVTEAVIRIPADNVGDEFRLTLLNWNSAPFDGALGSPDDSSYPTQSSVTVNAIGVSRSDGSQTPFAFAVYRAPVDFVRQNPDGSYFQATGPWTISAQSGFGSTYAFGQTQPQLIVNTGPQTDDALPARPESIEINDLTTGKSFTLPVVILRPPVVMIHGLWSDWTAWNKFNPLVNGPNSVDSRFYIGRVSYNDVIGPYITASDPPYPADVLQNARANSLGFDYNAFFVAGDINGWINNFKLGSNPLGIPAADVQTDLIAHSMGGDLVRTMALQPEFLSGNTFGQGNVHKLITIDTPHLGSPLANNLLSPNERGGCVEAELAKYGSFVFNAVQLSGPPVTSGAIADLSVGSEALTSIANGNTHPLPTALIAGINPNFDLSPPLLAIACTLAGDQLAETDTSGPAWAGIFVGQPNDAVVTEASQLDNLNSQLVFAPVDHSPGVEGFGHLGFAGPNVLDADSKTGIPSTVIKLLNTMVTNSVFFLLNP